MRRTAIAVLVMAGLMPAAVIARDGIVIGGKIFTESYVLGEVAANSESPRFTGTITLRYLRPTRLGRLHAEARITRTDGIKAYASGHLADE